MNIRVICNFNKGLLFYKSTLGTRHSFVIGIGKILSSYLVEGVYEFALCLWKCTCQTIQLNLLRVQFQLNSLHEILIAHDCEYFQFLAERTVLYEIEGALLSNHRCYLGYENLSLWVEVLPRYAFLTQVGHRRQDVLNIKVSDHCFFALRVLVGLQDLSEKNFECLGLGACLYDKVVFRRGI